ncbi:alcohol dehydrogenase [Purpureocillium lavendulum]|uniref:Alcohol dehydrogenase n=1 Tax=Purpureocillium lavendulum TaxID=1247861 RepID=A0AB34FTP1_9HYPO|nr:alcohol dehydrogenase [Purpureocillium lavendulum]
MLRAVTCLVAAASAALAVTPIPDDAMTQLLNEGGVSLAMKAQPMFFFGQAMNRPPCIPTWATSGSQQTPSSPLCDYPNVGCSCVNPDKGIGNPTQRFPIYYSYARCSDTVIRVAYNLFYTKDGAKPKGINGHPYDWERVLVELRKAEDTQWRPYQLHLSQHSGYDRILWGNIQNTFADGDAGLPRGGDNGKKNLDHPKVYVAWSKHANYQDRNTGWNDPLSQLTNNAFRSQDWWYFPTRGTHRKPILYEMIDDNSLTHERADDYIRADRSTDVGRLIGGLNWGDASSNPASVYDGLCTA